MRRKIYYLFILVFISSSVVSSQAVQQLSNTRKAWLAKANRHEKNGWIYLHIEGTAEERGFQHGFFLAKEMSFVARWGSACGTPFNAKAYLENHQQFDWLEGLIEDRPAQPWTSFKAGEVK